jgi:hypothetical protein
MTGHYKWTLVAIALGGPKPSPYKRKAKAPATVRSRYIRGYMLESMHSNELVRDLT